MKWKTVRKGNKWVKRPVLDVDEWLILVTVVLIADFILLQLIFSSIR